MNTQFWGRIENSGQLNGGSSTSNNLSPEPGKSFNTGTGVYNIVLDEWVARIPNLQATPAGSGGKALTIQSTQKLLSSNQYQITLNTFSGGSKANFTFYFAFDTGYVVTTTPKDNAINFGLTTQAFKGGLVLVPTYNGVKFDKGTMLDISASANSPVTFSVSTSALGDDYTIAAYTNGSGSPKPVPWTNKGATLEFVSPTLDHVGTHLTLGGFTFVAKNNKDGSVLSSDPIVRVRTVGS